MVTYVLDASAVLRYLDGEAGVQEVSNIFHQALQGECSLVISAVNWGEVAGRLYNRHGESVAKPYLARLLRKRLEVIPVSAERALAAALIKSSFRIPYADSFGVELAQDSPEHILVTADFDVKPLEHDIKIIFLPTKPKP